MASKSVDALMEYTVESSPIVRKRSGGSKMVKGLMVEWAEGGEAGGVSRPRAGRGPGEHTGRCLFGMAAGVPLDDVFSVR
jgi:hypothetical protein